MAAWLDENVSQFDMVHLHDMRTYQNIVARRATLARWIPYVLSAHGALSLVSRLQTVKRVYDILFGDAILRSAARLLAVSPLEARQYAAHGQADKVELIYNGLNVAEFESVSPAGQIRERMGVSDPEAKIILFLGRLHKTKGVACLLRAFAQIPDPSLVLVLAGPDGGELASLRAEAERPELKGRVFFPGGLYEAKKMAALAAADVLVYPSVYEIFGLVPWEALLCNTPVIVAEGSGMSELIAQAGAGRLVPTFNLAALAVAIRETLAQPDKSREMVRRGQEFIRRHFDWERVVTAVERVYELSLLHQVAR
jgi:glycosyltransferase involved in cell wall biosynthesis